MTRIPSIFRSSSRWLASFTKKYPNVKTKLKVYSFTPYTKVIRLAINGDNPRTWPRATRATASTPCWSRQS